MRALVFALLLVPTFAYADGFENVPGGSRTAAMGGAGVAGGYDSAMPVLNPAGLARIPGSVLSVSASLYQYGRVVVPGFAADGAQVGSPWGALDVSQSGIESAEFSSFPSSIAYMLHFGSETPTVLAGSLSIPRSIRRRFVETYELVGDGVTVRDNYTTIVDEQQYVGAFSWATRFGRLRVGASLLGSYTTRIQSVSRDGLVVLGTANFSRAQAKETESLSSIDLGVLAGAQLDVSSHFRVGATVRSPSLNLWGTYTGSVDATLIDSAADTVVANVTSEGSARRGLPLRFGVGVEAFGDGWTVVADGTLYVPRSAEYMAEGQTLQSAIGMSEERPDTEQQFTRVEPTSVTFNIAVGGEYRLTESNWLRLGVFTDFTAQQSAAEQMESMPNMARPPPRHLFNFPIDKFGASVGWGTKLASVDTTIGARGSYGSGQTLRYVPDQRYASASPVETTDASVYEVIAFLSASLDLSDSAGGVAEHFGSFGDSP
ncbi:MAG: hypothetical protein RIT81_36170 [Deltaproteobacteria bacterium]